MFPRKIVCPADLSTVASTEAESKLVFRIFVEKCSDFNQKVPPILKINIFGDCCFALVEFFADINKKINLMEEQSINKIKWVARIMGTVMLLFITPFYFGYDFPIPNSSLSFYENLRLIITPIMLLGLLVGWRWEKIAGYMICIPIGIGLLFSLIMMGNPGLIVLLLAIPGGLYLYCGYKKTAVNKK